MNIFAIQRLSFRAVNLSIATILITLAPLASSAAGLKDQLFTDRLQEFAAKQAEMKNPHPATLAYISEVYTDRVIEAMMDREFQTPLFRDELANDTMDILLRKVGKYPVLIGDPGVGKTAVLDLLTANIVNEKFPQLPAYQMAFQNTVVLRVSGRRFMPGGTSLHTYLETVNFIKNALGRNIIVAIYESHFLDDVHISILREFADAKEPVPVILETDSKSYGNTIKAHPSFSSISKALLVPEMTASEVTTILKEHTVHSLEEKFLVKLSDEMIAAIVDVSKEFRRDIHEPRRSMYLAEEFAINWVRTNGTAQEPTKQDLFRFVAKAARLPVIPQNEEAFAEYMNSLRDKIKSRVVAQDVIIDGLVDQFKAALQSRTRQHSVAMLLGPTGVGKSLAPEVLGEEFYGSDSRILKLDMTQFGDSAGLTSLFGAANGFISSDKEKGVVCDFFDGPGAGGGILVLNEIEEAHGDVFTRFMEMFDNGEFRGGDGRLRNIGRTLIVLTSNKNTSRILSYDTIKGMSRAELKNRLSKIKEEDLKKAFSEKASYTDDDSKVVKTAVLERIDRFYFAAPLLPDDALQVAGIEISRFLKNTNKQSPTQLEVDPSFAQVITDTFYNEAFGARQIRTAVQQLLTKAPAEYKNKYGYESKRLVVSAHLHASQKTVSYVTVKDPDSGNEITIDGPRVPVDNKLLDPEFRERLINLEANLNREIFGQKEAIKDLVAAIHARYLRGGKEDVVAGFLIGTTGAGKSQIAKSTAKHLFGREDAYELFEMGKIKDQIDLYSIFSPPKGIIGSDGPGQLEQFLIKHPDGGILLFDEMSNAGGSDKSLKEAIAKQFYTIMQEGYYKSPSGKIYDVSNHVIIFTGNDGEELFRGLRSDSLLEQAYLDAVKDPAVVREILLKAGFSAAFLGRLAFASLMKPTLGEVKILIARKMLGQWRDQVQKLQPFDIEFDEKFIEQIGLLMFSPESGARSINHFISASLGQAVADEALKLDWESLLKSGERAKISVTASIDQAELPFYTTKPHKNKAMLHVSTSVGGKIVSTQELEFTKTAQFMHQVHEDIALATAYHEMAHAVAAFTETTGKKVRKITIVPEKVGEMETLGMAQYRRVPVKIEVTREFLVKNIAGLLAGSEAEILLGRERNTGRGNDLDKVGDMARRIVLEHHLVPELDTAQAYIDKAGNIVNNLPPAKAQIFEDYITEAIDDARALAIKTLKQNWHIISAGAELLMKNKSLSGKDFDRLNKAGEDAMKKLTLTQKAIVAVSGGSTMSIKVPMNLDGVVHVGAEEPDDDHGDCESRLLTGSR